MTGTTLSGVSTVDVLEAPSVMRDSVRERVLRHRVTWLLAPALVFLAVRQLGLLALQLMPSPRNQTVSERLRSWDGNWFIGIADKGYNSVPSYLADAFGKRTPETPLAFFPGYPALVRWVDGLPGVGVVGAAFTVSLISGVFCAYGLYRLGCSIRDGSPRAGLILVALFAASPMAVVLSMTYAEATFCAFAAWALVGVVERRWILAGLCCAAAGLVRPTAAALIAAVGLVALVAVIENRGDWKAWVGGAVAPLGMFGYLGWVALRTGQLDGWFALQERGWGSRFDGGAATWEFALMHLANPRSILELATVWFLAGAIVLLVVGIQRRVEWPLLVYAAGVLILDIGSNGLMNSKARLLLPAFTLLVPIALALAKRRLSTSVTVLGMVAVFSAWFGAYAITAWQFAI